MNDSSSPQPSSTPTQNPNSWRVVVDNRLAVLILLFGVTGFLGIPVLWLSRGFSTLWKIVLSIVVTIYTCVLIAGVVAIFYHFVLPPFREFFAQ